MGHSLNEAFSELSYASGEVGLLDEFSVLSGRGLSILKGLDKQFQIIPKIQTAFGYALSQLMSMRCVRFLCMTQCQILYQFTSYYVESYSVMSCHIRAMSRHG